MKELTNELTRERERADERSNKRDERERDDERAKRMRERERQSTYTPVSKRCCDGNRVPSKPSPSVTVWERRLQTHKALARV
jgi:hypothetical protein